MFTCPLKQSISRLWGADPNFDYVIGQARNSKCSASLVNSAFPYVRIHLSFACKRLHSCRALKNDPSKRDTSGVGKSREEIKSDLLEEAKASANVIPGNVDDKHKKETQRTKKIGHGNKGRVPWNKGRKHSEETRERISRRTREALQDPKVRKKMSEAPRVLSYLTKVKIRASLKKLWGRRLRLKRSKEKFLRLWAESIALAAKNGGDGQQELEWDTYEKFKLEEAHQNAEVAKMKRLARIRKEREAKVKAALKTARLAQKKREQGEDSNVRQESIRKRTKWSKEEKEKLVEFQEEKLKERLMKIQRKKSTISRLSSQNERAWEKFDVDLAKGKHLQKDISLADQIRSAKKRRAQLLLDKL